MSCLDSIKCVNLGSLARLNCFTQVAGPYVPQFEIYWKKLDPENTGKVIFVSFFITFQIILPIGT